MTLEHSPAAVWADFAFYGLLVVALAALAVGTVPTGRGLESTLWVLAGVAAWTLAEYALHRFVLHGLQPFKRWHARHHQQPVALIATPTALTAALFIVLVLLPAWWLAPLWRGAALSLGVLAGYLAYTVTHHAVHHSHGRNAWLMRRKRWHALHHRGATPGRYGVTLGLWDRVFRSTGASLVSARKAG